jgi:hypothetical protein
MEMSEVVTVLWVMHTGKVKVVVWWYGMVRHEQSLREEIPPVCPANSL